MENEQETRIEAYLNKQMSKEERKAFEFELKSNEQLRRNLERHKLVEKIIKVKGQETMRSIAKEVRQTIDPLVPPQISVFDRIRFFFYSKLNVTVFVSLIIIIAGGWSFTNYFLCPTSKISHEYFIEPKIIHLVAGENEIDYTQAQKASDFYTSAQEDSLLLLIRNSKEPSVPLYYLAHLYLKNKKFKLAGETFEKVIPLENILSQYSDFQDMSLTKFNSLLSQFGTDNDWEAALKELDNLENDPDPIGDTLRQHIQKFKKDLKNPVLRVLCYC